MLEKKGVKLEINSQGVAGKSLNLNAKFNAPMNTIMSIASLQETIKDYLQVRKRFVSNSNVKDYLTDRQAAERKMKNMAVVKEYFTTKSERDILENPGTVSQAIAKSFAESEFEKYRIVQDRLFESDFDKMAKRLEIERPKVEGKERGKK